MTPPRLFFIEVFSWNVSESLLHQSLIGWERWVKRAESATWVQQLHREILPIHETVTWADCHRSPAPSLIYWLRNAGHPGEAPAVTWQPSSSLCPSSSTSSNVVFRSGKLTWKSTWREWKLKFTELKGKIASMMQISLSFFYIFLLLLLL